MLIYLVGFMGSGKSTIGKIVAKKLGFRFIDLDDVIESLHNMPIGDIFKTKGEDYFRSEERMTLQQLPSDENIIISTGGGCPCYFENMNWMNDHGITIYLDAHYGILYSRLHLEKKNRPLIAKFTDIELMEYILDVLPGRHTFYKKSKLTIEIKQETPDELAVKMISALKLLKSFSDQ